MNKSKTKSYFKKAWVITFLLGLLISGCSNTDQGIGSTGPEEEAIVIPVSVQEIQLQALEKKITLGGLLKPQKEVTLMGTGAGNRIISIPVKVGSHVTKGQILLTQDLRDLEIQQNNLELSRNELLDNLDKALELVKADGTPESQVTALENQLLQLESQLESLILTKEKMTIAATINGIISQLNVTEGQLISAQMPVATIVNIDKLLLDVQVGENYIKGLKVGEKIEINLPSQDQTIVEGLVKAIPPTADLRTKAYIVTIEVNNKNHEIKGGMYGEVELTVDRRDQVLAVPQYAIVQRNDQKVVFVAENGKAKMRVVTVGVTLGDVAEIIEGLQAGDQVIVEGQYGVGENIQINIVSQVTTQAKTQGGAQ